MSNKQALHDKQHKKQTQRTKQKARNEQCHRTWIKLPLRPLVRVLTTKWKEVLVKLLVRMSEAIAFVPGDFEEAKADHCVSENDDTPTSREKHVPGICVVNIWFD